MKGTVKRFYFRKGFGFIEGDAGTEYFFHYSDFDGDKRHIRPGLTVSFEARSGDKGPCATGVAPLDPLPETPLRPARDHAPPATPRAPRESHRPREAASRHPAAAGGWPAGLVFTAGLIVGMAAGAAGYALLSGLL